MRKLIFELTTSAPTTKIWQVLTDIKNYSKYIKYCHYSHLVGDFKEGSTWYDFSTVAFIPIKVNHKIEKIIPNRKIVYVIKTIFGKIRQTILIEKKVETTVRLQTTIDFPNHLIDKTLGVVIYLRNKKMLKETIQNYKRSFSAD